MNFIINIINYISKKTGIYLGAFLCGLLFLLAGCTDELMIENPANSEEGSDEDCIALNIQLDKSISTRDNSFSNFTGFSNSDIEKYDDYIDTQDKFRVFFFSEQGDFLFGATDRVLGNIKQTTDYSANYWYVRIPMSMIVDRENQEYDIEKIKNYLKNNRFKVAVLANWPNAGVKINPADWDDSEGYQNPNDNPSSTLKGNPHWTWSNSILNNDANPEDIRNINDLHHLYKDDYYANTTVPEGGKSRKEVYGQFMSQAKPGDEAGYYMGEPTDWVKMRDIDDGWRSNIPWYDVNHNGGFTSKNEANAWIRANCTPNVKINQDKEIYRHYQHMWFLWNFDASFKTGNIPNNIGYQKKGTTGETVTGEDNIPNRETDGDGNFIVLNVNSADDYLNNWGWKDRKEDGYPVKEEFAKEWYKRNGDRLYQWMKKSYNNGGIRQAIGELKIDIGESNNDVFFNYLQRTGSPAYCVKVNNNYGILLPNIGKGEKQTYTGMMQFQARTSGTLRIKWASANGSNSGLAVQVGLAGQVNEQTRENTTVYKAHEGVSSTEPGNWKDPESGLEYLDISIDEDSKPVYIFCTEGQSVVYSIEFIRGLYLYNTDREGVAPGPNHEIPMYGVRDFEPIKDWQRGTTLTLDGNISLIRALAKVEVFIKKDFGEPRHLYMRGMNRAARCEPMDVHTPTDVIWSDLHSSTEAQDEQPCEWFNIQKHGPSYNLEDNYSDWLSWFYGSWKYNPEEKYPTYWKTENAGETYKWDYNLGYYVPNGARTGWKDSKFNYSSDLPSPHIFNPYIYRSDFCRFLYVGTTGEGNEDYYHYVLYMPEKYIDDPSTVGKMNSNPKVPHIEYRFHPKGKDAKDDKSEYNSSDTPGTYASDPYSNTEYNLDDYDCYRIYFTNYGKAGTTSENVNHVTPENPVLSARNVSSATYDAYERNKENLTYHWPIMRNHAYKLYVGGSGPENPEIHVLVSDWSHRKVVVEW